MGESLHGLLEDAADRAGDQPAVVDGDTVTSYRELEHRANQLARHLLVLGVRPGDRVGLHLEKSTHALVGVYGTGKAGAGYVPLAADLPAVRLGYMLRDAAIRVVLTTADRLPTLAALAAGDGPVRHVVVLDRPAGGPLGAATLTGQDELAAAQATRPGLPTAADELAYVLYTSGSTGAPKGVMLSHRNALSFVDWAVAEFGITAADRLSSHAPLHFDLSVFDLFAAARAAATVVLVGRGPAALPAELAALLRQRRVSVCYAVPSVINLLATRGGLAAAGLPDLRLVLFAGESFPVEQLRRAMRALPGAEFANLYGPTETNVCTFHRVPRPLPERCAALPIGVPIPGVEVFARTPAGEPAAPGELGELWVRGPTVMRGYLGDPERTAEVLRAPAPGEPPAYRTGDLASLDRDGRWCFAGRRDAQIKSRGYRIELGEIEVALHAYPQVLECAVLAVPDELFGNRIVAHVATADGAVPAGLRAHCRARLPGYMVPWTFLACRALPRTGTGKIDYQYLKQHNERSEHVARD